LIELVLIPFVEASDLVASVLSKYNLKNLDEVFPGKELTTTEFMARQIHDDLIEKLQKSVEENCDSKSGEGEKWKGSVQVKLWESHNAWASYEGGEII
jgi:6-pyruvoyl-tetrahydropterin synthase